MSSPPEKKDCNDNENYRKYPHWHEGEPPPCSRMPYHCLSPRFLRIVLLLTCLLIIAYLILLCGNASWLLSFFFAELYGFFMHTVNSSLELYSHYLSTYPHDYFFVCEHLFLCSCPGFVEICNHSSYVLLQKNE